MKRLVLILIATGILSACGSSGNPAQPALQNQQQSQQSDNCIITDSDGKLCGQDAVSWCDMALRNNAQLSYQGYNTGASTSGTCAQVYIKSH